jgi:hypothetical protein
MFKYCLINNPLAKDGKNFVAMVRSEKTVDLNRFIKDMVDEGTGLTRPQALAYFEKITQLVMRYLEQGYFVSTPLFRYRTSIAGTFNQKNENFDRSKHVINITASAGTRIRSLATIEDPVKVNLSKVSPEIFLFIDCKTDECNLTGTINDLGLIQGTQLSFDKADLTQGVFFVSATDATKEYRAMSYARIKPSEVNFMVPNLEPGEYKIVVRNMTPNNKEMVSGTMEATIMF